MNIYELRSDRYPEMDGIDASTLTTQVLLGSRDIVHPCACKFTCTLGFETTVSPIGTHMSV